MPRIRMLMAVCVALGVALAGNALANVLLRPATISPELPDTGSVKPGAGTFLVATRALTDPSFAQTVVYLVEHNEDGTMGLIVNRSTDASLASALPEIEDEQAAEHQLYYGGPVGLSLIFMLLRSETASGGMAHVSDDVYISTDRRVLDDALAEKKPAGEMRFYIGHSGWAAGQLDDELVRGGWHVVPADSEEIFSGELESLWERLIGRLEPGGLEVHNRRILPALAMSGPDF